MANCPKCHGDGCVEDGIVNGKQRYRAIGCFLEVSHVAVCYWVKSFGKAAESARNTAAEVKVVEMDELHSYVGHKKTTPGLDGYSYKLFTNRNCNACVMA